MSKKQLNYIIYHALVNFRVLKEKCADETEEHCRRTTLRGRRRTSPSHYARRLAE